MQTFFQLSFYTGQQLVLEGLHRWLQRPCHEDQQLQQQRQRRNSVKALLGLLLKTAATGVLATVLDAAIDYRRRQLLQAAAAAGAGAEEGAGPRPPSLGLISRAGISALKARLLLAIDELERQAGRYGIEGCRYPGEGKPDGTEGGVSKLSGSGSSSRLPSSTSLGHLGAAGNGEEEGSEEQQHMLARTVEQLRSLVAEEGAEDEGSEESSGLSNHAFEAFLDTLLGNCDCPCSPSSSAGAGAGAGAVSAAAAACGSEDGSGAHGEPATCHICMDRLVRVQAEGCCHELCFQCARRLCVSQEHQAPQCPFCRQAISGFSLCSGAEPRIP